MPPSCSTRPASPEAAETLLTAELKRSQEPYYDMLVLADLAKERGD